MRKKLTLMFVALIAVAAFAATTVINALEGGKQEVIYALEVGETFTSGQTVDVKNVNDVVATITYGEAGGAEFAAAKADGTAGEPWVASTAGNGTNGNKTGGTFYTIVPKYDGTIDIAVALNADKKFYIKEDGNALEKYNAITVDSKYNGTFQFAVSAGKSYKVYCDGSKLGFFGFKYVYTLEPKSLYIAGLSDIWDISNMTEIPYNKDTKTYVYEANIENPNVYFAISDVASSTDWGDFNGSHRYAIVKGQDYTPAIGEQVQLIKTEGEGAIGVPGKGKYKFTITEDMKMTITEMAPDKLYIIGDVNGWDNTALKEMTFNATTQTFEYTIETEGPSNFSISTVPSFNNWDEDFKGIYRYAIGEGNNTPQFGEEIQLTKCVEGNIYLDKAGKYLISVNKDMKITVKRYEDIVIDNPSGDLAEAIAAAEEGKAAKNITINLTEGAKYTISAPIVASASVTINGNGATIDASEVDGALITVQAPAAAPALNRAPANPDPQYTFIENVTIKDITITGIKGSVFFDEGQKLNVEKFMIDNAVLGLETASASNNSIIAFSGGGVKEFTIKNSTVYGNKGASYFFSCANGYDPTKAGYSSTDDTWNFTYLNNTFYKVNSGNWANNTRVRNVKAMVEYNVEKNIWVECGNSQIPQHMQKQQNGYKTQNYKFNTYYNGTNVVDQSNYTNGETALPYNEDFGPLFADPDNGDFTLGAGTPQAKEQTGATKWLVPYDIAEVPLYSLNYFDFSEAGGEIDLTVPKYYRGGDVFIYLGGGTYTLKSPIIASGESEWFDESYIDIYSVGNATIDVSNLKDANGNPLPMIQLDGTAAKAKKVDGTEHNDYKSINEILIYGVNIKGLKNALIKDKQKTLVDYVAVVNSTIDVSGNNPIFDFNGKGYPGYLYVNESTLASENGHTGFFLQSGGRVKDLDDDQNTFTQELFVNSTTFYQIAKGKKMNNLRTAGQKSLHLTLKNSLLYDTGSNKGNEVNGWLGGQNSTNPTVAYENNSYWANDAEATGWYDSSKNGSDQSGTQVYGKPFFRKLTNSTSWYTGDFTLGICAQIGKQVGDPRWYNIPMITNLQNALTQSAALLIENQSNWLHAKANNDRIAKLAAAHKENIPYLTSGEQEEVDAATARVLAAIAEFLGNDIASDPTAIESVNAAKTDNAAWYTINGQRVDRPTQKGLYIHNGRKVVIK